MCISYVGLWSCHGMLVSRTTSIKILPAYLLRFLSHEQNKCEPFLGLSRHREVQFSTRMLLSTHLNRKEIRSAGRCWDLGFVSKPQLTVCCAMKLCGASSNHYFQPWAQSLSIAAIDTTRAFRRAYFNYACHALWHACSARTSGVQSRAWL